MKKYLALFTAAGLVAAASIANATISGAGTIYGNAFLFGFNNENTTGVVTCSWTGYQVGSLQSEFEVVIYSSANDYAAPYTEDAYPAYDFSENYSTEFYVPAGNYTEVDCEAQCDQYPVYTTDYVTSWWIYNQ